MTTHQPDQVPSRRRRLGAWCGLVLWVAGTVGCAVLVGVQTWWLRGLAVGPLFGLLLAAALTPRR